MKLVSFETADGSDFGIAGDRGIVALKERLGCTTLSAALGRLPEIAAFADATPDHAPDSVTLLPPIPKPDRIFCVGLNYLSHLEETGRDKPAQPIIFTRFASSLVGHNRPLVRPRISEQFDFEGELAVIIGKPCRHVAPEEAHSVIAGYSCFNDGSIREWQYHSSQFTPGKNFASSGAVGPYLVTTDAVDELGRRSLITRLNGTEMQRARLDDMAFDIPTLIAYCSTFTPLSPGDVIATGTTGGVGAFRKPPVWMRQGDRVEVEIEGIGSLANPVEDETE